MDTQVFYVQPKPRKSAPVRAYFKQSVARLGRGSSLLQLILSELLCAVVAYTIYVMSALLGEVLYGLTSLPESVVDLFYVLALALLCLLFLLPLIVGRIRMAGLISAERGTSLADLFYYFSTGRRYGRGVLLGILHLLSIGAPIMLTASAFGVVSHLYTDVLLFEMDTILAVLVIIPCYMLCALFGVLCLFLSGIWLSGVAIGIGNEQVNPFHAFGLGIHAGCGHLKMNFHFLWCALMRALLSLLTVGVLWLLYYGPLTAVAYMQFAEETQHT